METTIYQIADKRKRKRTATLGRFTFALLDSQLARVGSDACFRFVSKSHVGQYGPFKRFSVDRCSLPASLTSNTLCPAFFSSYLFMSDAICLMQYIRVYPECARICNPNIWVKILLPVKIWKH